MGGASAASASNAASASSSGKPGKSSRQSHRTLPPAVVIGAAKMRIEAAVGWHTENASQLAASLSLRTVATHPEVPR